MATIKSHTDIEQSKKLAEIAPIESADMYYFRQIDNDYFPPDVESICPIPLFKDGKEDFNYDIRCWSLAALLSVIPKPDLVQNSEGTWLVRSWINDYPWSVGGYSNPIDACVAMLEKLNELNLL